DSARRQGKGRGGRAQQRGRRSSPADSGGPAPTPSGGTWEPDRGAPPRVYYLSPGSTRAERMGAVRAAPEGSPGGAPAGLAPGLIPASTVDMDVASAAEIERLPRIGPALARRIVEDRTAHGPFGSLEELMRVKGIGPGIARAIAPFVTFTQTPRPSSEGEGATGAAGGRGRRLRKPHSP
ncbi:MAG TPA: helix-hairpin-helix domain-containing protein, partial [Gemmatimonadaceae bacterium]|nr:helix-hairpin-helix domain-containing protein [Gemmatimonadaceae bacterium]